MRHIQEVVNEPYHIVITTDELVEIELNSNKALTHAQAVQRAKPGKIVNKTPIGIFSGKFHVYVEN